jgi:hypothetical protein
LRLSPICLRLHSFQILVFVGLVDHGTKLPRYRPKALSRLGVVDHPGLGCGCLWRF